MHTGKCYKIYDSKECGEIQLQLKHERSHSALTCVVRKAKFLTVIPWKYGYLIPSSIPQEKKMAVKVSMKTKYLLKWFYSICLAPYIDCAPVSGQTVAKKTVLQVFSMAFDSFHPTNASFILWCCHGCRKSSRRRVHMASKNINRGQLQYRGDL